MVTSHFSVAVFTFAFSLLLPARPASAQADLALVLAVDVSSSVDEGINHEGRKA